MLSSKLWPNVQNSYSVTSSHRNGILSWFLAWLPGPQKSGKAALHQPEVSPYSVPIPSLKAQSWHSPEQRCLLRLRPPRFPSAHLMGPQWQGGESKADPHYTAWNLAILSKLAPLGWVLSVSGVFLLLLPLPLRLKPKWMQPLKSSPPHTPIYFWGECGMVRAQQSLPVCDPRTKRSWVAETEPSWPFSSTFPF